MTLHVLPINDLRQHVENGIMCWCEPRIIVGDEAEDFAEYIVVHNSLDGREWHERFANL